MMKRAKVATLAETSWQKHTVRGFVIILGKTAASSDLWSASIASCVATPQVRMPSLACLIAKQLRCWMPCTLCVHFEAEIAVFPPVAPELVGIVISNLLISDQSP